MPAGFLSSVTILAKCLSKVQYSSHFTVQNISPLNPKADIPTQISNSFAAAASTCTSTNLSTPSFHIPKHYNNHLPRCCSLWPLLVFHFPLSIISRNIVFLVPLNYTLCPHVFYTLLTRIPTPASPYRCSNISIAYIDTLAYFIPGTVCNISATRQACISKPCRTVAAIARALLDLDAITGIRSVNQFVIELCQSVACGP